MKLVHSLGEGLPSVDSAQYVRLGKNSLDPDSDIQTRQHGCLLSLVAYNRKFKVWENVQSS
ncbi:hypothetical protein T07_8447 [Trichinella nelsoni]|uniref:Uncharacterized protein n=1 Tax=Trichinella nelsoni TaxID=6336 RepID=A0A0V0RBL0_9BILA|nr:hypothetical protein T07_8447 [Trichinella nelsoni]